MRVFAVAPGRIGELACAAPTVGIEDGTVAGNDDAEDDEAAPRRRRRPSPIELHEDMTICDVVAALERVGVPPRPGASEAR